jgi:hypothetical protein
MQDDNDEAIVVQLVASGPTAKMEAPRQVKMSQIDTSLFPFSNQYPVKYVESMTDASTQSNGSMPRLSTADSESMYVDIEKESDERVCLVSLANRTRGVPWFALTRRWLPFPANLKAKYLALLVELNLGCWPGWTYHPGKRTIACARDSDIPQQSSHAVWTFVHLVRAASPLA